MPFSEEVRQRAYQRAGGRCECTMRVCTHYPARCNAELRGEWHAHHRKPVAAGGDDAFDNCIAMCVTCYLNTATFGQR